MYVKDNVQIIISKGDGLEGGRTLESLDYSLIISDSK